MKEQQFSEIPVSTMTHADMVLGTTRLDGMKLCEGCQDYFVLQGFCGNCERINAELENRRRIRLCAIDRIDNGTVEFEEQEAELPASPWDIGIIFVGAFCSAMLTMTALWFGFRWLIAFCLRHS